MGKPLLLIDGDVIAYRAAFATEKTKYLVTSGESHCEYDTAKEAKEHEGVLWSRKELKDVAEAEMIVRMMIKDMRARYPKHVPRLWLSPLIGNFRDTIATRAKYKGNRDGKPKPTHLAAIRMFMIDDLKAIVTEGQEADDAIGIDATANPGSVLASIDKDLLMIPGIHFNFVTKEEVTISPKQAMMNFYTQMLTGDAADNVPGVPGIGPAKAKAILAAAREPEEARTFVHSQYRAAFGASALVYFQEAEALLWIRRFAPA